MSEWSKTILRNHIDKVVDNRGKNPPYMESGYPVIETGCISGNNKFPNLNLVKKYVDQETYDSWFRSGHPEQGDLLIITVGNGIGSCAIYKDGNGCITQNLIGIRPIKEELSSEFLYYYLSQNELYDFLQSLNIGSAQPSLKVPHILGLEIPYPPLPEQKAIASVLSSLDDKIDLLHRQNKTLEAMAETLFRQWFIEDAKENWEEVQVKEVTTLNRRSVGKNYIHGDILYLDTGSLTKGVVGELQSYSLNEAPSRAKRLVQHNDILISTVRPNQCHYGIVSEPKDNLVVSTGFCTITCETISPYFVYLLLTNTEMTEYLHSIAEGSTSTYPSLKPEDIGAVVFQMPPKELLQQFHNLAESYWQKIHSNHKQIQTLENLRDTLLPKLMSGEVRVEYQTKEVA